MTSNDNAVNIEEAKRGYHHGDLRSAAVAEGLRRLEAGALDQLSLREVARNVGVSATALYRHFPDKKALLRALAGEGDRMLGSMQREAYETAGGGKAGFIATGRAYVKFALAHPALFRLLMSCAHEEPGGPGENVQQSAAMAFLRENIAARLPEDASARRRHTEALRAWVQVHGLAMLMIDGVLPPDETLIDTVIGDADMPAGG